jgi:hypothetical protein
MANNEFLVNRVVATNISYPSNTASTFAPTDVYIPTGAIVTGVTLNNTVSWTLNAAGSQTMCLYVSTDIPLNAVTAVTDVTSIASVSNMPYNWALLSTAGMYISKGGPLYMKQGVSNGTSVWTYKPDVYVGYLKA